MGSLALVDATTWVEDFDFTTRLNELSVDLSVEELEDTTYGTAGEPRVGRSRVAGLADIETELNGYWESLDPGSADAAAFNGLGTTDQVVTHSVDGAEQSVSYFYQARKFNYQIGDEIGSVLPFTLGIMGSRGNRTAGAVRGRVAKAKGAVSAGGQLGSGLNLGSSLTGETVYAVLHVLAAGTSVTVEVQRDADNTFATPTTVATINDGPITAAGGYWSSTVNAVDSTDAWYRLQVTAAITGTFTVAGAIGIK